MRMRQINRFETITPEDDDENVVAIEVGFGPAGGNSHMDKRYHLDEDDEWPIAEMEADGASYYIDKSAAEPVFYVSYDAEWWDWFSGFVTGSKPESAPEPEPKATIPEIPTEPELGAIEVSGDLTTSGEDVVGGIEIAGDMTGEGAEVTEGGNGGLGASGTRKKSSRKARLREGAGCKQPDEVDGFMAGRLLCVTKRHRSTNGRDWGRCEYRVRCNKDGSYTLEYFAGNRTDVKTGDNWATASIMFKALLALPPDTMHHKMTIKRYFKIK